MKKQTLLHLIVALLILILVAGLIIYHSNYSIALKKAGFSENSINYIDSGINDDGNEYRVVFQYMPENTVKCALLTKDKLGIWKITEEEYGPDSDSNYLNMGWMRFASICRYAVNDQTTINSEVHQVYGGNNAVKQIEIPYELLPANVCVDVFQAGAVYLIHFIAYGDAETLNQINVSYLLGQTNSIPQ